MIFLVDYDNIRAIDRNRGLSYIVERVVRSVGVAPFLSNPRARVRLYGGWHLRNQTSRMAQGLASDIASGFPRPIAVTDSTGNVTVTARVELAHGLECDPRSVLRNTFRTRSAPQNLKPKAMPYAGCSQPAACPLAVVNGFLTAGVCQQVGCTTTIDSVMERAEQKLVDGMIVADALHLSTRAVEPIAVVSSDDDLWPAVHGAVIYGANVYHVQTHAGRVAPPYYSGLIAGQYTQFSL